MGSLIDSFKTDDIIITRFGEGKYVKGIYKKGKETQSTIKAVVTPLRGQDLLRLSEGKRTRESIKVYTEDQLTSAVEGKLNADIICLRGVEYEVQESKPWLFTQLEHYESLAVKVESQVEKRKVK